MVNTKTQIINILKVTTKNTKEVSEMAFNRKVQNIFDNQNYKIIKIDYRMRMVRKYKHKTISQSILAIILSKETPALKELKHFLSYPE